MENENNKNYLDERENPVGSKPPEDKSANLDPENEIKSGPKRKLIDFSGKDKIAKIGKEFNETGGDASAENAESENINKSIGESEKSGNEVLDMIKKKRRKDMTIPIILGIVSLITIVIVASFYFLKDKDIPIIEKESPQQKILNESMMAMNNIESYSFEGDFNLNFTEDDKEEFSLATKFDGQADESDMDNIKSSFNVKPKITISKEGGSEDISFDFSMKSFGKIGEEVLYLKLGDFDLGAAGMMFGEAIIPYKNKWYFLDMKELQEKSNNSFKDGDFDFNKMIEEIKDLSKKYKMIKFQEDLGDTKIGSIRTKAWIPPISPTTGSKDEDIDTYHYQVKIDPEAVLDFYVEILETTAPIVAGDKLAIDDVEKFKAELEENKEEILAVMDEVLTNVKTEIWIGKEDKMIYKMAMSGKFDDELAGRIKDKMEEINKDKYNEISVYDKLLFTNTAAAMKLSSPSKSKPFELSFDMSIMMSDFNQPINISKPKEAEDLMKVLEEMMMGFMGGMMTPEISLGDDSDQDDLTDEMEAFYGTDPNNPDTDGDGFNDGDEVMRGYDPLLPGEAKLDYDRLFGK